MTFRPASSPIANVDPAMLALADRLKNSCLDPDLSISLWSPAEEELQRRAIRVFEVQGGSVTRFNESAVDDAGGTKVISPRSQLLFRLNTEAHMVQARTEGAERSGRVRLALRQAEIGAAGERENIATQVVAVQFAGWGKPEDELIKSATRLEITNGEREVMDSDELGHVILILPGCRSAFGETDDSYRRTRGAVALTAASQGRGDFIGDHLEFGLVVTAGWDWTGIALALALLAALATGVNSGALLLVRRVARGLVPSFGYVYTSWLSSLARVVLPPLGFLLLAASAAAITWAPRRVAIRESDLAP
jgi:hypothetical protein